MTPPPQRLKCTHRMVCFRHNGEGADKAWGTDAGCIPDCNQYVIASHSSAQSEQLQHASARECNKECPDKTSNCQDTCEDYYFRKQPMEDNEQSSRDTVLNRLDEILKHEWNNANNLDREYRDQSHSTILHIRSQLAELHQTKAGE